ncbi:DUF2975 domain-containing protein [Vagococcus hydrophili]|uniref:DUF2975 domain-containing protein n=1 Tax=Vagococcus hydrophili TaxID=2714947 RepID=A0A6G8AUX6_9ENTE|nr:DUF2975 domain-containing protein [Vagococcus hydrophili]QIL48868.1 DUF2975 domain-containing protein [Vagococcus hydrophili]
MTVKKINLVFKSIIIILGVSGLSLLLVVGPKISDYLETTSFEYLILGLLWVTALPVIFILFKLWKISSDLLKSDIFSIKNSQRLIQIAYASLVESGIYGIGIVIGLVELKGNYPFFLICFFFFFVGLTLSVIASLLSYIFKIAGNIKEENDLTI